MNKHQNKKPNPMAYVIFVIPENEDLFAVIPPVNQVCVPSPKLPPSVFWKRIMSMRTAPITALTIKNKFIIIYLKYFMKSDLVDADPTKTPFTFCKFSMSDTLSKFTEPPYKIFIFLKEYFLQISCK